MKKTFTHVWPLLLVVAAVALSGCGSSTVTANRSNAEAMRVHFTAGAGSAATSTATKVADPDGFAPLSGSFTVNGTPPSLPALAVSGNDAAYCSPGGKSPPDERVVVGPNGGLRDVLIFLEMNVPSNEKWEHPDYLARKNALLAGTEEGFDQKNCIFLSHVFAMRSTQTVEILNSDSVGHNTKIEASGSVASDNKTIPSGGKDVYAPGGQASAPFSVACSVHTWMKAYMISRDNPFFAVSDETGKFEIQHVPTGVDLKFRVWQEKLGFVSVPVKVNGQSTSWNKGRLPTLKLTNGSPMTLDVEIDAAVFN